MRAPPNVNISAVEARCPGFRVIAGPFDTHAVLAKAALPEQRMAATAKRLLLRDGIAAKIIVYKNQSYVLRTVEGWADGDELKNAAFRDLEVKS